MIVSIIAAVGKNGVIGTKNGLPWYLPSDLKRFKEITTGHPIIMGRKTLESIGRVLPGRKNIVLTKNKDLPDYPGIFVANSLEEAIQLAKKDGKLEAFVIGGDSVFKDSMGIADKIYITEVDVEEEGDAYFPEIDMNKWQEIKKEEGLKTEKDQYSFRYINFERKSNER